MTNPAAAGFAVYGCCSVASAASLQHGFGFRFGHVPAGDSVVIVRGDGDVRKHEYSEFSRNMFGMAEARKPLPVDAMVAGDAQKNPEEQ
ncbi:hypothetical protein F3J20_30920 [Paraburkholderia sp. Cy-641]|uniref:hypothetical protein n=1 Tax=Paraburkholderia sp. Cy-641 TaxID=2608337 RepID=UPI00141DB8BE|nr:hypothetical protein [Paraburkholderia sp. Cy-641]NIF81730.1 hypothetical protein [Paraburkholderia sp. Cy-641]